MKFAKKKRKSLLFLLKKQAHVDLIMLAMMKQGGDCTAIAEQYDLVEEEQHDISLAHFFDVPYIGRFGKSRQATLSQGGDF